jgi:3-dehydroquinate synthase
MTRITKKTIPVSLSGNRSYPIVVGCDLFLDLASFLKEASLGKRLIILTHPNLNALYGAPLATALRDCGFDVSFFDIPEGESSKNMTQVSALLDTLLDLKIERQDTLLALGGGVIGDLTGFVAAIYLRGINFVQVPTTLLAQVDASIGGKTGINHPKGKNLIGAFYQPKTVYCDFSLLHTLPQSELRSGLAEVVKYGIIRNAPLYAFIQDNLTAISELNIDGHEAIWQHLIEESCADKAFVVSEDEREADLRAILNFGHTIGHGIEAECGYGGRLHGECVAVGMIAATHIAVNMGLCDNSVQESLRETLKALGFELKFEGVDAAAVFEAMRLDKKVKAGKLSFVLPTHIGSVVMRDDVPEALVKDAIKLVIGG